MQELPLGNRISFALQKYSVLFGEKSRFVRTRKYTKKKLNSVACSPQANYTDRAAAAC
jgi:hypothetical protein